MSDPLSEVARGAPTLHDIERAVILARLRRFNGHRAKTAESLGIAKRTLGYKLARWDVTSADGRAKARSERAA